MQYTIPVQVWLDKCKGIDFVEGTPTVLDQLAAYDAKGSGVGFIFVLSMLTSDTESPTPSVTNLELESVPVAKICGTWMVVEDGNLSDILAGVIRMLAPNEIA